jgi:ubiquinone/menaquinone biosynthesis C-methylase UbiE
MDKDTTIAWQEHDSSLFIDMGRVMIPRRDEIERTIVGLIPAREDEPFVGVDLAAGSGWLSRAILERFPQARMLLLDGSETMLAEARSSLSDYDGHFDTRIFRLEDDNWIDALDRKVRCVVSSLAVHHLDDAGKQRLFARLYERLEPGGALLIADLVQPTSEVALRFAAEEWNQAVRRQSLEQRNSDDVYRFFVDEGWNIFEHPDPMDMPSYLPDQLTWLTAIGYTGVDAFWAYAGHAVYGGFRST